MESRDADKAEIKIGLLSQEVDELPLPNKTTWQVILMTWISVKYNDTSFDNDCTRQKGLRRPSIKKESQIRLSPHLGG